MSSNVIDEIMEAKFGGKQGCLPRNNIKGEHLVAIAGIIGVAYVFGQACKADAEIAKAKQEMRGR